MENVIEKYSPLSEAACYVLLAINHGKKHGYAIVRYIEDISSQAVAIGNGTLYGILNRMVKDGVLEIEQSEDKKVYKITPVGKEILANEKNRLVMLLQAIGPV